jgi:MFS transporter, AAHS family, 4-hydroxybenzoate transporter
MFLDGYDSQALALAVPHMAEVWAVPPSAFAGALSASLAGIALGAVLLAPLADRFGRRPMLISMMIIIGLSTLGVMLSSNTTRLLVWRAITGLGLGGAVPVATALISEYAPARRRTALIAFMVACLAFGAFSAGIIAPILNGFWGWRGIFAVGAVLPLAMAAILWALLPESLRFASSARVVRASVVTLLGPTYWMRTILVWLIFWFNLFAIYSLGSWLPTLLHIAGWGHDAAQRAGGLVPLGGIAGGLLVAWVADRGHAIGALFCAYVGTAVLLAQFLIAPASTVVWVTVLLLVGAGAVGAQLAAVSIVSAFYYPTELRATGVGWFNGVGRTGAMIGPLVLAGFMKAGWTSAHILGFLAIPMLICAGGVLLLPRALRSSPPADDR